MNWRYFGLALMAIGFLCAYVIKDKYSAPAPALQTIAVSDYIDKNRADYILHGNDSDGGGHKYGTGRPCKSEFPEDWDERKILQEIALIAANDNLPWHTEGNGYDVVEHISDGVRIRVIYNRERGSVVTAYPKSTPRNPCPSPANDN